MRTLLILGMFAASYAQGAWSDYEEVRDLSLDARNAGGLVINAGAGSLDVEGVQAANEIQVKATIQVPGKNDEDAQEFIAAKLVLSLQRDGDMAVLIAYFEDSGWAWNESPGVSLEVTVPQGIALNVDDGSGSLTIENVRGDIRVDDSSGSIKMSNVGGTVDIEDGSGSIKLDGVGGDISIEDGSGSIDVAEVTGSVIVDDGSGSITVHDVSQDLIIVDDGSGSINYKNVQGNVEDNS